MCGDCLRLFDYQTMPSGTAPLMVGQNRASLVFSHSQRLEGREYNTLLLFTLLKDGTHGLKGHQLKKVVDGERI